MESVAVGASVGERDGGGQRGWRGVHNARTQDECIVAGGDTAGGVDVWSGASGEPRVEESPWDERGPETSAVLGGRVPLTLTCGQRERESGGGDAVEIEGGLPGGAVGLRDGTHPPRGDREARVGAAAVSRGASVSPRELDLAEAMLAGARMGGDTMSEYGFSLVDCPRARR
jgi:hypothetical protein